MDEDAFTEVKRRGGPRKQGTPAAGRRPQQGTGQQGQKRGNAAEHLKGYRYSPRSGRGARSGQDTRQHPVRYKQTGQRGTAPPQNSANRQCATPSGTFLANGQRQGRIPAASLLQRSTPQRSHAPAQSPRKEPVSIPASRKRTEGLCYAQIVAERGSRKVCTPNPCTFLIAV
jgi:hypothetical protein